MQINFNDLSSVEKYEMPSEEYEARKDSVLAWKKAQKLGRFDPNAPTIEQQKIQAIEREIEERGLSRSHLRASKPSPNRVVKGIAVSLRARLLPETDARRGTVAFVGPVPPIPGLGSWVGIALDEPTGKNDGSVAGHRYFQAGNNHGVFVRPDRVEVGDFPALDDLGDDMEEI
jgi:tubulin-folding cofactor B